jgi:hypothetical protein
MICFTLRFLINVLLLKDVLQFYYFGDALITN